MRFVCGLFGIGVAKWLIRPIFAISTKFRNSKWRLTPNLAPILFKFHTNISYYVLLHIPFTEAGAFHSFMVIGAQMYL